MKTFGKIISISLLVLFSSIAFTTTSFAAEKYAVASGDWHSTTTWSNSPTGASGASLPANGDNVFIQNGKTVTISSANTANLGDVTIQSGGTIQNTYSLKQGNIYTNSFIFSKLTVNANAIYVHNNLSSLPSSNVTWNAASTLKILTATSIVAKSFGNIYMNCTGISKVTGGEITVNGNMEIVAGTFVLSDDNPRAITIKGNLTISGGVFDFSTISATNRNHHPLYLYGSLAVSNSGFITTSANNSYNGVVVFSNTTSTQNVSLQSFPYASNTGTAYVHFKVPATGNVVLNSDLGLNIYSDTVYSGTVDVQGILNLNSYVVRPYTAGRSSTGNSLFIVSSTGKIISTNDQGIGGSIPASYASITQTRQFDNAASYEFNGGNQTLTDLPANIKNLTISGSGNKTMVSSTTASGVVTFTNGYLITTSTKLLNLSSTASVAGANDYSFVKGPIAKYGTSDFEFPVGGLVSSVNKYRPIKISNLLNTIATDFFTAEHVAGNALTSFSYNTVGNSEVIYKNEQAQTLSAVSSFEYWNLSRSSSTSVVDLTMDWSVYPTSNANAQYLRIGHYSSSNKYWENAPNSAGIKSYDLATKKLTVTKVNNFSPFAIASISAAALPVTLTNFTAKAGLNNTVNLSWATSTEIVNKGFRIERQSAIGNGKFENIGFVASKASEGGSSSTALYYSFTDVAPASNATNYYRLAQVDLDGKTTYSDVKQLRIGGEAVTMVYPNPSNGAINISRSANASKMNIQILDMSGKMVQQYSNVSDANFKINIGKAGMYNVKMINAATGEQSVQRIVVQK